MDKAKIKLRLMPRQRVSLSIRISPECSRWLKKNGYSPTGIFRESIKDLGYTE